MKFIYLFIIASSTFLLSTEAFDGNIKFRNDDNTTFKAKLFGDEWFSWIENTNKDVIVYNSESKNYEYAKLDNQYKEVELIATGIKVTSQNSSFLKKLTYTKFKIDRAYLIDIWNRKRDKNLEIFDK